MRTGGPTPPAHHKHALAKNQCKVGSSRRAAALFSRPGASTGGMQRILREGFSYLLAMALVVLLTSAACFWLLRSSYAGVSDDVVAERGLTAHGAYIGLVARAASRVLVGEILCLAVLTGGLFSLWPTRPRAAEPMAAAKALLL